MTDDERDYSPDPYATQPLPEVLPWADPSAALPPEAHRVSTPARIGAGSATLLLALGAAAGAGAARLLWRSSSPTNTANGGIPNTFTPFTPGGGTGSNPSAGNSPTSTDTSAIASKVDGGVVDITISNNYQGEQAAGTGIVLTSDGEVLTNNHVIAGATTVTATDVGNGQTYRASVLGYDRAHDVALLKLHGASGLQTLSLGDSDRVQVGATVVAVGNAGGRGGTPSYDGGTVTGLDQPVSAADPAQGTVEQLTGLIETNANIVAGESGGPLVDAQGRVIGMITAGSSRFQFQFGGSDGFAIPINTARSIVQQIELGQSSGDLHVGPTAFLGVEVQSENGSSRFGSGDNGSGATIARVVPGSPAEAAGLSAGDTITAVDGHQVTTPTSLSQVMVGEQPGRDARVDYVTADGQQRTTTVHLASGPPQ